MKNKNGFYATIEQPKKVVKQLQAYYLQGGKWKKVKTVKGL